MQRVWTVQDWENRRRNMPAPGDRPTRPMRPLPPLPPASASAPVSGSGGQHAARTASVPLPVPARTARPSSAHTSSTPRKARLLFILVALWLALLIWPTPQLGAFLSNDAPSLVGGAVQNASTWAQRTFARIPQRFSALTDPHQQHTYWQVGLAAGDEDAHATGFRTTIATLVPQRVSPDTTNYFWTGSYLSDGSFIQIGYYVPARDTAHAGWFYCAFYADGHSGPCVYGPLGSAGANGSAHTYALDVSGSPTAGGYTWTAQLDGASVGAFPWAVGETGTNAPVVYAESSGYKAHDATSALGPVDFISVLAVRHTGASAEVPAAHLYAAYNAPNVCPPYGIAQDGKGGVLLGSGLTCPDAWAQLR